MRAEISSTVAAELAPVVEDAGGLLGNNRTSDEVAELAAPVEVPNEVPNQVAGQENTLALNNMSVKKALCMHGQDAKEAILKEFRSLFIKKKALQPVKCSALTSAQRKKLLRSHMLLKENMMESETLRSSRAFWLGMGALRTGLPTSTWNLPQ